MRPAVCPSVIRAAGSPESRGALPFGRVHSRVAARRRAQNGPVHLTRLRAERMDG